MRTLIATLIAIAVVAAATATPSPREVQVWSDYTAHIAAEDAMRASAQASAQGESR